MLRHITDGVCAVQRILKQHIMKLTPEEILKVKTKNTANIVDGSPLYKAVISAMKYYAKQEVEAGQHETIVNCPEPFTAEFLAYLLVNALRHLNEAQRHNLALSLAVRDPLFSIEEYEKQLGN